MTVSAEFRRPAGRFRSCLSPLSFRPMQSPLPDQITLGLIQMRMTADPEQNFALAV